MSLGRTRWLNEGSPQYGVMAPIVAFKRNLGRYGITVGTVGNQSHMLAAVAEDHTWYSQTGWPGQAVLGWVYACDPMTPPPGLPSLTALGAQLVADKMAAVPGTEWIKYINWTDAAGDCWHEAWDPNHRRVKSNDRWHIHVSGRTDYLHSTVADGYDLVARTRTAGGIVVPVPESLPYPAFGGRLLRARRPMMHGADVLLAQKRFRARGWVITADGWYGSKTAGVVTRFQRDSTAHGWPLLADGVYGPNTHRAAWLRPVS